MATTDPFLYTDLYNNARIFDLTIKPKLSNVQKVSVKAETMEDRVKLAISNAVNEHFTGELTKVKNSDKDDDAKQSEIKKLLEAFEKEMKYLNGKDSTYYQSKISTAEDSGDEVYTTTYKLDYNNSEIKASFNGGQYNTYINDNNVNIYETSKLLRRSQGSVLYYSDNDGNKKFPIFFTKSPENYSITQSNSFVDIGDTIAGRFSQGIVDAKNNVHDVLITLRQAGDFINRLIDNNLTKKLSDTLNRWAEKYNAYNVLFNASNAFKKYTGSNISLPNLSLTGYIIDDKGEGSVIPYIKFLSDTLIGNIYPGELNSNSFTEGTILAPVANVLSKIIRNTGNIGSYIPPKGYITPDVSQNGNASGINGYTDQGVVKGTVTLQYMPGVYMKNLLVTELSYTIPNMRTFTKSGVAPFMALINLQLMPAAVLYSHNLLQYLTEYNLDNNINKPSISLPYDSYQLTTNDDKIDSSWEVKGVDD